MNVDVRSNGDKAVDNTVAMYGAGDVCGDVDASGCGSDDIFAAVEVAGDVYGDASGCCSDDVVVAADDAGVTLRDDTS